ncbi:hypothetical protein AB0A77_24655 [Streptomyces varsoviensis]|uniref:DUF7848 domain-containing protein n=1 Tax=Streptomyces varsoviensis TaxID=67373 RepID=UPI0033EAB90E
MKSVARAELARMMAEQGRDGVLLMLKPPVRLAASAPGGGIAFPPCQCAERRAGWGRPGTGIRLADTGRGGEVTAGPPVFSAQCVPGDGAECGAASAELGSPDAVRAWLRRHADETGHRRYRRIRSERVTLDATSPRRATRHCLGVAEVTGT